MLRDSRRIEGRLRSWQRSRQRSAKELERLHRQAKQSIRLRDQRSRHLPKLTYPEELPISIRKEDIRRAIEKHPVVIVAGETGSGKTTQLPKICLEAGRGIGAKIACTQPRRVAALSISRRIAQELGVSWGREVGCKIRFTDETSDRTYIKLVTDGMLLSEIQGDRQLFEYDTIIVDEAHERSLNIDFLLGHLKLLRRQRPDLKIIITSATIDTEAFSKAFDDAPVIEVSGRVYPVEVRHWALDELLEESGDYTYIEAAVQAVDEIVAESPRGGDILLFMPTEGDIHETRELLEGRRYRGTEVLPLFGRLTAAEQQRVFGRSGRRRIVVATNIAETSLTIPGIRYVVDTGLARLSRFNPRTRTRRLPIEPISQSSADQRKGRCGRVANGVCIRLYSEEDYLARPQYTQPEIQRADLADVILHMSSQRLGEIETFPFIDRPTPQAIRGGYQLLQELGALDEEQRLTRLGRDMARLPIDPTDARMILQAQEEGSLQEVLVIAAAISIQDPRERPLEQQQEADQMHKQFVDQKSDFLTLLNIWNAYHDKLDELRTQSKMRKFCKSHFLSYIRMREWRDIHSQLSQVLREIGGFRFEERPPDYDAIHRSVLSGLLSNIAIQREHNIYQAARAREVMIFPGSGLFQRKEPRAKRSGQGEEKKGKGGEESQTWVVAAEMVETSRLFARTVARIDPAWLSEIGAHLCNSSYKDPYWNLRSGRVLVQETLTLYGLQVLTRRVPYNRIDAREATEIFIREALMPGQINTPHPFLEHNVRLYQKLETWQTRISRYTGPDLEERVADFYRQRLDDISSVHDLNRLVRERRQEDRRFLFMEERDLLGEEESGFDGQAFPDALDLDGEELPLSYAYRPGREEDGVTVRMPYKLVHAIEPEVLEWLVPGLLEEKVTYLLRSLPKSLRKQLVPIPEKARAIAAELKPTHPSFLESLQALVRKSYRVDIRRSDWKLETLPDHLRMRVEVQGTDRSTIATGRDVEELVGSMERHDTPGELEAWKNAVRKYELEGLRNWSCGDLPERIEVAQLSGVPLYGYPGLVAGEDSVDLKLFKSGEEARLVNRGGLVRLCELVLEEQVAWLRRQLQEVDQFKVLYSSMGKTAELREASFAHLEEHLFLRDELHPLEENGFQRIAERAREELRRIEPRFIDLLGKLLKLRHEILVHPQPYPGMRDDLERLMPGDFLRQTPFLQLHHLCRYLQTVLRRAERYRLNPGKDEQMTDRVKTYQGKLAPLLAEELFPFSPRWQQIQALRWMAEEYRVSVFAQELGTAHPISPKRLDKKLEEIENLR